MKAQAKSSIPELVPLLKDADPLVRINAIWALSKNGMSTALKPFELGERSTELETAIASLIPFLKTSKAEIRQQLTLTIGNSTISFTPQGFRSASSQKNRVGIR